jgi:hypothetical protein
VLESLKPREGCIDHRVRVGVEHQVADGSIIRSINQERG